VLLSNKKTTETKPFKQTPDEQQAISQAMDHHKAGRLREAVQIYQSILSTNPNHPMALHYLGLHAYQVGQDEVAIDLMKKAVALQPDYGVALGNLASTLVEMECAEEAIVYANQAIALNPNKANLHTHLGKAFTMLGQFEAAVNSCQIAVALDPMFDDAYAAMGAALGALGRTNEAITAYKKAIEIYQNEPRYHNDLGNILSQFGHLNEAISCFKKAIFLDPDTALLYNNLGSAFHFKRKLELAEENYKKAILLYPEYEMAYQNLANVQRDLGRTDEAIATLRKLIKIAPDMITAQHNLKALLGETTDRAPKEYVEELFDQFANQFEHQLKDKLNYKAPTVLKQIMVDLGLADHAYNTVVDMGCGTGLSGLAFRDIATTLIGIDLSTNMVREAEKKEVYDQLTVDDLIGGLAAIKGDIDLFIACDVFVYIGNLHETFAAVKAHAAPGAVFAFSTEHTDQSDTFVLQDTSRYAHAKAYIDALASEFGFTMTHFSASNLRQDKEGWIQGGHYLLQRDL